MSKHRLDLRKNNTTKSRKMSKIAFPDRYKINVKTYTGADPDEDFMNLADKDKILTKPEVEALLPRYFIHIQPTPDALSLLTQGNLSHGQLLVLIDAIRYTHPLSALRILANPELGWERAHMLSYIYQVGPYRGFSTNNWYEVADPKYTIDEMKQKIRDKQTENQSRYSS